MFARRSLFALLLAALVVSALALAPFAGAQEGGAPDYWPTEGWRTSTPEEQGMDSAALAKFLEFLKTGASFHSALVIRHGYVVLDVSTYPFTPDQPHALYSVTKSVISTLAGIAVDKGYIQSADQSIWDFFPKEATTNMDARKEAVVLKHLLTQSSGLGLTGDVEDYQMYTLTADDQPWVQYVLDHPMATSPGATFNYLDANAHLISAIISQATGVSAYDFAQQNLFSPLGITDVIWVTDPQGVSRGGSDAYMSAYDMAKLGYLYLRNGEWDGQQIVSPAWVADATADHIQPPGGVGAYGYLWWTTSFDDVSSDESQNEYAAIGLGGQEIWVIPDSDLVVVLTSDLGFQGPYLIDRYLLKAVQSDTALPNNPEAFAALTSQVDVLAHPAPAEVPPLSETQQAISGKAYTLADNPLGWKSIALEFKEQEALLKLDTATVLLELPVGLDGLDRISLTGFPANMVWWPLDNVPLALRGSWFSNKMFRLSMRDMRGTLDFQIDMTFGETVIVTVTPRLPLIALEWQKPAIFIQGTPQ